MVVKLILLAFAFWFIYMVFKAYAKSVKQEGAPPTGAEDMVRCSHCGVHLPKSEGILSRGEFFCSDEHRRLRQK